MTTEPSPGTVYEVFLSSEELVEKIKLLDYEKELVPKVDGFKILPRHYFAQTINVGEQFFIFTELAAWLMRKAQWKDVNVPSSNDDPNLVVNTIQEALRVKGIEGNYATQKLKSGSGKQCLEILTALADAAIEVNTVTFQRMIPIENKEENEEQDRQEEEDLLAEQFDEEDAPVAEDEDDVTSAEIHEVRPLDLQEEHQEPLNKILHSVTESNALKREIDRVLPQLRITIRASDKHWRMHDEQLTKLQNTLNTQFESIRPFLAQLSGDLQQNVERITLREKHLNEQLQPQLNEFRIAKGQLAEITEKYKEASVGLDRRQENLQMIGDEIDQLKQQIERQVHQNSSGSSLVKVQQAIGNLEKRILEMQIQIAVLEQNLHNSQLNEKNIY